MIDLERDAWILVAAQLPKHPWIVTPVDVATAAHDALTAGRHGEELRHPFSDDAVTVEHPNVLQPRGACLRFEEMLAGPTVGARLPQRQVFEVHQAIQSGEEVVMRLTWTGRVEEAAGPFAAGQELRAHIAQFVRAHEGRIRESETFDCYEPFE